MYKQAEGRLNDADILSKNINRETDSNYLLELLAFELLLKCIAYINTGNQLGGHDYLKIFNALSDEKKNNILTLATERMSASADYSDISNLLNIWSKNFILLRYPYEKYEGMSKKEYRELGINWVTEGANIEKATFVYFPNELYGLNHALKYLTHEFIANK